ncbi:MAG TPA: hypothetical protein VGD37_00770 [Kofleriaceae bacterium]|jgi:hypothetical protein
MVLRAPPTQDVDVIIVFNLAGLLVWIASLIVGIGIADRLAHRNHALELICAGLALVAIDIVYRKIRGLKIIGWRGPAMFWLPAWIWGVLTFASGVSYLLGR